MLVCILFNVRCDDDNYEDFTTTTDTTDEDIYDEPNNADICRHGIKLVCRFRNAAVEYNADTNRNLYKCDGERVDCYGESNATHIWGHTTGGKTFDDVEAFDITKGTVIKFPQNLEKFFPNLKAIMVNNNLITHICNHDLISHPKLEILSLSGNRIVSLDGDLFDGLSNLKVILFETNLIKHIGHDIKFPKLKVNLMTNVCISKSASSKKDIESLQFEVLQVCPPQISQIEKELEHRDNLLTRLKNETEQTEVRVYSLERINARMRHAFDDVPDVTTIVPDETTTTAATPTESSTATESFTTTDFATTIAGRFDLRWHPFNRAHNAET